MISVTCSVFYVYPTVEINAQIKLLEVWKALNVKDYPLEIEQHTAHPERVATRACEKRRPCEIGRSNLSKTTSVSDAVRIWNSAHNKVTGAKTLYEAKNTIKKFVKLLPI